MQLSHATWHSLLNDLISRYFQESVPDPQKGYSALNSDFGLTCATYFIAQAVSQGKYKSNVYVYVNKWDPAVPIKKGKGKHVIKYAYHGWDQTVALRTFPSDYSPRNSDLRHGDYLQEFWYQLITTGALADETGWLPVNRPSAVEQGVPIFIIQDSEKPPHRPPEVVWAYKKGTCDYLVREGIATQVFWWAD